MYFPSPIHQFSVENLSHNQIAPHRTVLNSNSDRSTKLNLQSRGRKKKQKTLFSGLKAMWNIENDWNCRNCEPKNFVCEEILIVVQDEVFNGCEKDEEF